MTYHVELTEGAYADLDRLASPLARHSAASADGFTRRFHEALTRLETFPLGCGLAYESDDFPEPVRHLLFEVRRGRRYRALFVVRDDVVTIFCIRAPGERPVQPGEVGFP